MPVHVRPAEAREYEAVLALLPQMRRELVPLKSMFVAVSDRGTAPCGAAAFSLAPFGNRVSGLRGDVFVEPAQRRQGVGRALLGSLVAELRRWFVDVLYAYSADDHRPDAEFLMRLGFRETDRLVCFEAETGEALDLFERLVALLFSRHRIPANASVRPLRTADPLDVANCFIDFYGATLTGARAHLATLKTDSCFERYSLGLYVDDALRGLLTWTGRSGVPTVELLFMHASHRRGWGALLLLLHAARLICADHHPVARFNFQDYLSFPKQIATLASAQEVNVEASFALAIGDA